jgi:arginine-tRNA-protein transferase
MKKVSVTFHFIAFFCLNPLPPTMLTNPPTPFINETFSAREIPAHLMDALWATGWRHFGHTFFRYSLSFNHPDSPDLIQPLRLPLHQFLLSKSQRRILRRNTDADLRIGPAIVDAEREDLFFRHRQRFTANIPDSLRDFIPSPLPASLPCQCLSVEMRLDGRLLAVSYLDVGNAAVSSVYAMFDPSIASRSPGILTLLAEIEWARQARKTFLYPGYATAGPGIYDYKKSLRPLEYFHWASSAWLQLAPAPPDP